MQSTREQARSNRNLIAAGSGAALAVVVLVAAVAVRTGMRPAAVEPARQPAVAANAAAVGGTGSVARAYRMTYYLVGSDEQAAEVQKELDDSAAEAYAQDMPVAPSEVVVIASAEQQADFESGINECGAIAGCAQQIANEVDLRGER